MSTVHGSDHAEIDFSTEPGLLHIRYRCGEVLGDRTLFIALREGNDAGSAVLPFGENGEGAAVFLPFQAERIYIVQWRRDVLSATQRVWENWKWSDPFLPNECILSSDAEACLIRLPLAATGGKIRAVLYTRDFSYGKSLGWFFGCSDPAVRAGEGERYIPHYLELTPRGPAEPLLRSRGRSEAEGIRIYQLFVRLFGNNNETRQPNGTVAENGVGKFNDINEAALAAIRAMGFTHLWLTGVLQQASGTDHSACGQPAADPDLLKGRAGSPYAIEDYFDVSADYAVDPQKRLTEFQALLERLHGQGLKALIDFVPNHVARCYHSDIRPEIDFGAHDDRAVFFAPQNNFFHLQPNDDGPPLQLPTWRDGVALSPRCCLAGMNCDGRFEGELHEGRATGNNVASWRPALSDWYETVKLNYGFDFTDPAKNVRQYPSARAPNEPIPDTWLKMDQVIAYWQTLGVDGFRCDMAHMVPPEFWKWLIQRARTRTPDAVFIAEAYDNDPAKVPGSDPVLAQLQGGRGHVAIDLLDAGFDAVYDDPTYRVLKGIYEGPRWANDLDAVAREPFIFENSLRYAENHDEVRLASPNEWSGLGMNVGRVVAAILFGLSRGPLLLYNGQEVGEPAAGAEGFGSDDSRTSIFDYWSMPEMVRWVNDHKYDGEKLSAGQKSLREFYGRLVRLNGEPAFRDGDFFALNPANIDNPHSGRLADESASGHWCYAFWRCDVARGQRFLVVANLHPHEILRRVRIVTPPTVSQFLDLGNAPRELRFVDRLGAEPLCLTCRSSELAEAGLEIPEIPPLTALYLECLPNEQAAEADPAVLQKDDRVLSVCGVRLPFF